MIRFVKALGATLFIALAPIPAIAQQVAAHAIPIGKGPGVVGFGAVAAAANTKFLVGGGTGSDPVMQTMSGDCSLVAGAVTCTKTSGSTFGALATVTPGTGVATWATTPSSANLAAAVTDETGTGLSVFATSPVLTTPNLGTPSALTLTNATGLPIAGITGLGTGVGTALAVNVGSAGAPVLFNGAGGTPSSITLTNGTGLPVAGITASTSTALGVGSVELGHATDTTFGRVSAGKASIEGVNIVTTSSTDTLTNKSLTSPVVTGTADVQQALALTGDISPAQITANQNDYAPTGFSTAAVLRLDLDADHSITGLAGGSDGLVKIIHNISTHVLTLTNSDAGSTAGNQLLLGGDVALNPDTSITLQYDATSSRWRAITSPGSGGGGGGGVSSVTIAGGTGIGASGTCTITTSGTCTVSVADQFRQNQLLICANQAKSQAGYVRLLATFCDGYKASDGVNSGSSSNYTVNTSSGYVGPNPGGIDSDAVLMLHADGTNGSTTITDSSSNAFTATASGNAALSTSQQKFGTASIAFDGSGDKVQIAHNSLLSMLTARDFTADFWVRFNATGVQTILNKSGLSGSFGANWEVKVDSSNHFVGAAENGIGLVGTTTITTGAWYHVAFVKSGTSFYLFVNGTLEATNTNAGALSDSHAGALDLGYEENPGVRYLNGWLDEVRISKVARWTANFTPKSTAYTSGQDNATIVTASQTADATVSNGRVLMEIDPIDSITLNTDLTVEVTCNGGTNWASATLSSIGKGQSGRTVVETADTACTSGTSFAARTKTLNNKSVNVYKTAVVVH